MCGYAAAMGVTSPVTLYRCHGMVTMKLQKEKKAVKRK